MIKGLPRRDHWDGGKVLEMGGTDGYRRLRIHKIVNVTELYTLKMVKMLNFSYI